MGNENKLGNQLVGQPQNGFGDLPGDQAANPPSNPVVREHALNFIKLSLMYGICFTFAFYRNFIGITSSHYGCDIGSLFAVFEKMWDILE